MERLPLDRTADRQRGHVPERAPEHALIQALEHYRHESPLPAARSAAALKRLLAGVSAEAAWRFSPLTADGYPVELGFTSTGDAIRYTVEFAGPRCEPAARLDRVLDVIAELAGEDSAGYRPDLLKPHIERLRYIQSMGRLAYGTWISGRHGLEGDAFKLYAEAPLSASSAVDSWIRDALGHVPLLTTRSPVLRMIGLDVATGRLEFYFRADGLQPWEVHRLMGRAGLADQAVDLLDLVEVVSDRSAAQRLPFTRAGFSLSVKPGPSELPAVFSLFSLARTVIGPDSIVRRRLLDVAERRGWPLRYYAAVSAPLAGQEHKRPPTRHGMLSFVAAPGVPPQLHIGLRPPP
ncbi:hypothetical protein [Paenibacillus oceani]|uniref:Tryptophan dimethylallyltransferase n=1 Tax=Paenibacillus oceani TaxID=2772510 RepID=A0A927CE52_9BACL|nr:hypothetical protein [Paenibacillus oceani]MBD2864937.1 hypothetical protein [Paenibacillus oceani]